METRQNYSSFGGIMLWDASQAYGMSTVPINEVSHSQRFTAFLSQWQLCCSNQEYNKERRQFA